MITIFTPTFNRAYKLRDLFDSLMRQTLTNFEWLIIDDGSTDGTKELVDSFDNDGLFEIRYIYKTNEGKQVAINHAAIEAKGEWIFIVDSDDVLTIEAISSVEKYCAMIEEDESFAGVVGLRGTKEGKVWQTSKIDSNNANNDTYLENEFIDATAIEYRFKYNIRGDRAEVIRKCVLVKYPFPKYKGEKFIAESYLWYALARDGYKFRWFNEIIYITEYLEDGLTKNGRMLAINNPLSRSCLENLMQGLVQLPIKVRIISSVNYYRYGLHGKKTLKDLYNISSAKWISILSIPVALVFKIK